MPPKPSPDAERETGNFMLIRFNLLGFRMEIFLAFRSVALTRLWGWFRSVIQPESPKPKGK